MTFPSSATIQITRRAILRNIFALFSGNFLAQVITAITLLITARQLGPDSFGQYTSTLTLCTFASVLFSLGMDSWFLREAGREPNRLGIFLSSVLAIKVVLGGIWLIVMFFLSSVIDLPAIPQTLLFIAALMVWFNDLFISTLGAFKATFKNHITSIILIISGGLWLLSTAFWITKGQTQPAIYMITRAAIALLSLLFTGAFVWSMIRPNPQREVIGRIRHEIPAYAASEILSMAFLRVDVLIVAFLLGEKAVGLYAPALSLTNMIFLLQGAIFSVMTPILSNQFYTNRQQAWLTAKRMFWMQVFLGIFLTVLVYLSAGILVSFLGSRFTGTKEVLQILSINVLIHSITYAMAIILIALNQQVKRMQVQALAVAFNMLANLLVLKWAGIQGAAIVYVLSECIIAVGYSAVVKRFHDHEKTAAPRKQNILLINIHSTRNAGDAALTKEAIKQLHEAFPESQVTLVMNDPVDLPGEGKPEGSFFTWVKEDGSWRYARLAWLLPACLVPLLTYRLFGIIWFGLTPRRLRRLMHAYLNSDIVVSIPGGFIYTSGRGVTLLVTSFAISLAILAGKPLYIFPQSFGPFRRRWECWVVAWICKHARVVMVRERISVEQLEKCGVPQESCHLVPDLGFGFQGTGQSQALAWLESQGIDPIIDRPLLGITAINWARQNPAFQDQDSYEKAIAFAARKFITSYHGKVIFLPQCWGPSLQEDDRLTARQIANRLSDLSQSILIVEQPLPPELLKAVFGQLDLLIGTRMHSNIFALSQYVPVIAIGYLHKTLGIAQMVGIEQWVIDIQEVSEPVLSDKLGLLWDERHKVSSRLSHIIPDLVRQSQCAGQILASDFSRLAAGR